MKLKKQKRGRNDNDSGGCGGGGGRLFLLHHPKLTWEQRDHLPQDHHLNTCEDVYNKTFRQSASVKKEVQSIVSTMTDSTSSTPPSLLTISDPFSSPGMYILQFLVSIIVSVFYFFVHASIEYDNSS